jgi:AcrR family transcriptional regulator
MKRRAAKRPPRPTVRRAAPLRRASLCEAGWALLRESGPAAVTIDAVVARAGVTRPIFYRHFRDRGHFLAELFDEYTRDVSRRTEEVVARGGDPETLMADALSAYLDCVGERGAHVRALAEHAADQPDLQRARARSQARQLELLARTLESSGIDAPPATLRLYVRLLHGLAIDAATIWLRGEASRQAVEDAVRLIERGTFAAAREALAKKTEPSVRRAGD